MQISNREFEHKKMLFLVQQKKIFRVFCWIEDEHPYKNWKNWKNIICFAAMRRERIFIWIECYWKSKNVVCNWIEIVEHTKWQKCRIEWKRKILWNLEFHSMARNLKQKQKMKQINKNSRIFETILKLFKNIICKVDQGWFESP